MDGNSNQTLQIFARLLDGKTAALRFSAGHVYGQDIKQKICKITGIPPGTQRLISSGTQLEDKSVISTPESTVHLVLRLLGGKGGFGSLLRGAATKAGQKKTNNFDACRDMSGRRLRHVNAEKRLEDWKAEEEERRLERLAEDFIKKEAKKKGRSKAGAADREAEKYVAKYREDSAKCVVEVEEAVREACGNGVGGKKRKGKVPMDAGDAKKFKIWMGKRKLGESDSEDSDDDDNDDKENGKSTLTNNGSCADSNRETEGSSDSVTGGKLGEQSSGVASCESGSEEEEEAAVGQNSKSSPHTEIVSNEENGLVQSDVFEETLPQSACLTGFQAAEVFRNDALKTEELVNAVTISQLQPASAGGETAEHRGTDLKSEVNKEPVAANKGNDDVEKLLNFDEFNSAADLEVLGMERLRTELQSRGLKCGGTLQERAARLFLLKSTPLEKLRKKLLAKK